MCARVQAGNACDVCTLMSPCPLVAVLVARYFGLAEPEVALEDARFAKSYLALEDLTSGCVCLPEANDLQRLRVLLCAAAPVCMQSECVPHVCCSGRVNRCVPESACRERCLYACFAGSMVTSCPALLVWLLVCWPRSLPTLLPLQVPPSMCVGCEGGWCLAASAALMRHSRVWKSRSQGCCNPSSFVHRP